MTVTELQELLDRRFPKTKRSGRYVRIPCPTCNSNDQAKMKRHVPIDGHTSHCFICKIHMDVQDLVGDGVMFTPTPRSAAERAEDEKPNPRSLILPGSEFIPVNQLAADHPAVQFLHKDHLFDLDYYSAQGICYCPAHAGEMLQSFPFTTSAERLIFPVYNDGKLVGWQARSLPGTTYGDRKDVLKYYHVFNKGKYLYNYDAASKNDLVVVVEGVKKALKFKDLGVATFGTGISPAQKNLIGSWKHIVVMLDAEDHNFTQKLAKEMVSAYLHLGKKAINIDLRKYGAISPDDLPEETLIDIVQYEWKQSYSSTGRRVTL